MDSGADNRMIGRSHNTVQANTIHGGVHFQSSPGFLERLFGILASKARSAPVEVPVPIGPLRLSRTIALWGPPGSGKTCFVTALNAALAHLPREWTLVGTDERSHEFLTESTGMLIGGRIFPSATMQGVRFLWTLHTDVEIEIMGPPRSRRTSVPVELTLEVRDFPGRAFDEIAFDNDDEKFSLDAADAYAVEEQQTILDCLALCDGIVYFFDADREMFCGDAARYFVRTAAELERVTQLTTGRRGRLPQRLAVCVSKADRQDLFDLAVHSGHMPSLQFDETLPPRVSDDNAAGFFAALCDKSPTGSAHLVRHAIERYFSRERTRYFVTSATGYHVEDNGLFNPRDCSNVIVSGGVARIRGMVRPFNVLEPLLWLQAP